MLIGWDVIILIIILIVVWIAGNHTAMRQCRSVTQTNSTLRDANESLSIENQNLNRHIAKLYEEILELKSLIYSESSKNIKYELEVSNLSSQVVMLREELDRYKNRENSLPD